MADETRLLQIGDFHDEYAVVRIAHESVVARHHHVPHVHADAIEPARLDA